MLNSLEKRLQAAARKAAKRAYAPYSKFPVGAAVLGRSGKIYAAANVENASYGLTICAERAAVFAAVAAGERSIQAVAVHLPTARPASPCGACRQVISEFGPKAKVICTSGKGGVVVTRVDELLPRAFGPGDL